MRPVRYIKAVYLTLVLVRKSLPLMVDELDGLTGEVSKFVVLLKCIWDF